MSTIQDLSRTQLLSRVEYLEEALRLAQLDHLTGLPRREALHWKEGGHYALCDLDGFKRAQDAHPDGHAYGDAVLRQFAAFLAAGACRLRNQAASRSPLDEVAVRWGGDEFVVWCPTREGAEAVAERIRAWRSECGRVGASAATGATVDEADAAMFQVKRARGGR